MLVLSSKEGRPALGRHPARACARVLGLALFASTAYALLIATTAASAGIGSQKIRYRGYAIKAPASWPVHRLAADPSRCVRFDRHAVYLGRPGAHQRCPAHAVGHTEAILIEPGHRKGVFVTATSRRNPQIVERILGRARGVAARRLAEPLPQPPPRHQPRGLPSRLNRGASASYYAGLGFDACSAPSTTTIAAWSASPYRGVGVYIGGVNRACSQPNLTSTWVADLVASGWVLIPTYVGLQAPTNNCGCAAINPSQASAQGFAAAADAVAQAAALGIGPGNPIYFDMEGYARGGSNTSAVLTFLGAWTAGLHARGYMSGVYGSAGSTISDLVSQYGTGFLEPDDIWIANWNGLQTTADPYVPASYWSNHQRLHQYRGGHNETWGGVSINIDNDYLDGAVVGNATTPVLRRLRCPKLVFDRRPRSVAMRIRTYKMLFCGKARKVASASEPRRYTASGRDRGYRKLRFKCRGRRRSPKRVLYKCRRVTAKIRFVRVSSR